MIVGLEDDPFDAALANTPIEALDVTPRAATPPSAPAPRAPVTSPDAPRGRRTETARSPLPSLQRALAHADRALAHSAQHPEARPLIGLGALAMIPIAITIGLAGLLAGAMIGASDPPTAKAAPKVAIAAPAIVATTDDPPALEATPAPEPEVAAAPLTSPVTSPATNEATAAPEVTREARARRRPRARARARRARARRARPARASTRPVRIASR